MEYRGGGFQLCMRGNYLHVTFAYRGLLWICLLRHYTNFKQKKEKQAGFLSLLQSRLLDVIQIELFPFCDFELLHTDESRVGRL